MDDFDAIKRYINTILPVEIDSALVISVNLTSAWVSTKSGSPFEVQISGGIELGRGDTVEIHRVVGQPTWTITNVLISKRRGVTTQSSPQANKAPGGKEFASVSINNSNASKNMATGSVIMPLVAITKQFVGGRALVLYTGHCNVTTNGGTFNMQLVVDQQVITVYTLQQGTGITLAVPFTYVYPNALEGTHTFQVQAVSSASAATFVTTGFSVVEI